MGKLFYVGAPPLCSLLSESALEALRAGARRAEYDPNALVYARGDTAPSMVVVHAGEVELGNFDLAGKFTATSRMGAGHCFGEGAMLSGGARLFSARATMNTIVDHIERDSFEALVAETPEIGAAVMRVLAQRFQNLVGFVEDMRSQPLNVQFAKALLTVSANRDADAAVQAGTEELATMLAVSPVALAGVVARFEREGLVKRRNSVLDVPSREALVQWVARRTSRTPPVESAPPARGGGFAARRARTKAGPG